MAQAIFATNATTTTNDGIMNHDVTAQAGASSGSKRRWNRTGWKSIKRPLSNPRKAAPPVEGTSARPRTCMAGEESHDRLGVLPADRERLHIPSVTDASPPTNSRPPSPSPSSRPHSIWLVWFQPSCSKKGAPRGRVSLTASLKGHQRGKRGRMSVTQMAHKGLTWCSRVRKHKRGVIHWK